MVITDQRSKAPTLADRKRLGHAADAGRFLRINDVIATIGLSRSQIYRMIDAGEFPKPIPLTARAVGWWESSVNDWLRSRGVSA